MEQARWGPSNVPPMVSTCLTSKPAPSRESMNHPRGVEASAPGKMYLFMKRPQMRSCCAGQHGRHVATKAVGTNLVLPALSQTSDLQEEGTVILEHVVDLLEEGAEVPDTDVLGHFETGDLVVLSGGNGSVAVVHAQDLRLRLWDTVATEAAVAPGSLVASESDTSDMSAKVLRSKAGERSPATSEIKHLVARLQVNLGTDDLELVVLKLLESLLLRDVGDDTGSVNHARAQEPTVEVITAVVVIADLLLIWATCQQGL
jgi:hypothetical protein